MTLILRGLRASTEPGAVQTAYIENDPTGQPLQIRTPDGKDLLYIYDGLGSPMALFGGDNPTAESDYRYDPFGVQQMIHATNHTVENPFAFTGGLYDRTTNWVKLGARYYSPASGRWFQMDTLDAPLDPRNANRYVYANNNPVNYVDPSGRSIIDEFGKFLDVYDMIGIIESFIAGDVRGGAVGITSLTVGWVVNSVCAGIVGGTTAGTGLVIGMAGCLALGYAASKGIEALAG